MFPTLLCVLHNTVTEQHGADSSSAGPAYVVFLSVLKVLGPTSQDIHPDNMNHLRSRQPSLHRQSCLYQLALPGTTFSFHIRSMERGGSPGTLNNTMRIGNLASAKQNFSPPCLQSSLRAVSLAACMSVYLLSDWFQFWTLEGTIA